MTSTVLIMLSVAALLLAGAVAAGLVAQSRRLERLRRELGSRESDLSRMRAEWESLRRDVEPAPVSAAVIPRQRRTSPPAWRRAHGGAGSTGRRVRSG